MRRLGAGGPGPSHVPSQQRPRDTEDAQPVSDGDTGTWGPGTATEAPVWHSLARQKYFSSFPSFHKLNTGYGGAWYLVSTQTIDILLVLLFLILVNSEHWCKWGLYRAALTAQ